MPQDLRDVGPRELRLPPSRREGADLYKLQRQIARFGASSSGMPPPWVYEASDGVLVLYNGVTRATRIARWALRTTLRVEVEDQTDRTLWDVEDTELLEVMEKHREDLLRRQQTDA